jgi:N-acetylglutamate synthase-like GNAT family acetyltransferase
MGTIRRCGAADFAAILAIVNDAAQAYRGRIPADRWHDPYMPADELERELAAGVGFWGYEEAGALAGVIGLQDVRDVALIRHAYVATAVRGQGIGGALLAHIIAEATRPMLVGTWAAATWAIRFYQRHGFQNVSPAEKDRLLRAYWAIPDRQIETSVVLADARWRRLQASSDPLEPQEDPS